MEYIKENIEMVTVTPPIKPEPAPKIDTIRQLRKDVLAIRDFLEANDTFLDSLPLDEFYEYMALLPAQSYGPKIEKRFINRAKLIKVKSQSGRGDAKDANDQHSEVKASISRQHTQYNIVQVRDHHDIKYYYFIFVSFVTDTPIEYLYKVPAQIIHTMAKEWGLAHGTKANTKENKSKEKRRTITVGDPIWESLQPYRIYIESE